jgi:hypothetical protein
MVDVSFSLLGGAGWQFFDNSGRILAGGRLYSYEAGSTTAVETYTNSSGNVSNGVYVQLDSAGRPSAEVWLVTGQDYKFEVKSSTGTSIRTYDDIPGALSSAFALSLAGSSGAGLIGYLYSSSYLAGTVGKKLQQSVNLDDFAGANDHAKLVAAVSFCGATGMALNLPSRIININTDLGAITLENVTLQGEMVLDGESAPPTKGAIFYVTGTTNSLFKIRRGVTLDGFGIYYPGQTDSATPTAYPWTLDFDFTNGAIQFVFVTNTVVYNSYNYCNMNNAAGGLGHCWFVDNSVYAINETFYVAYNDETLHFSGNDFTFGIWTAATEGGCRAYTRANGTVLKIDRSDGVYWQDNLCFGYLNGWLTSATGNCVSMKYASNNAMDNVRYGINATGTGNISLEVGSANDWYCLNSQDTTLQGNAIRITTSGSERETITIAPQTFSEATEDMIYVSGNTPTRDINITSPNALSWASHKGSGTYGFLNLNGNNTSLNIVGGTAMGANNTAHSYGIMGSFNELICNGFKIEACQRALSVTLSILTGSGNESVNTGDTVSDVYSATTRVWGPNNFDKPQDKSPLAITLSLFHLYADNASAVSGGQTVGSFYLNSSTYALTMTH